jgi:pyruvate/2-oxoglutarate dehydrogenase complex dihydrolipoamide dehydrogenase (E3) component
MANYNYDICIIGAGAGGLSVAAGACQFGIKVALIEGHNMGGDCLNYGCVPSKALLSSAKHYNAISESSKFGFSASAEPVNIAEVMAKVQEVIAQIAPHDSVERFTGLGATVYRGYGSFVDEQSVKVNDDIISAKYFIIATGSSPVVHPIPGLNEVSYLTNETIFNLQATPEHLVVIGGGPIGCELAQAFLMLGIKVSLLNLGKILPRDEADLVAELRQNMLNQGLNLYEDIKIIKISSGAAGQIEISVEIGGKEQIISGSHLLVATGRKVNIDKLNLSAAGIEHTSRGIQVDECLRTSNKKVFAIGDVAGGYQFTHIAGYHAGVVIRNIIFRQRAKVNYQAVPWVTYTYPELAHVGLLESEAQNKYSGNITISEFEYKENDRAQAERALHGKIKLITTKKGKVLGVSILGLNSGELLAPWIDLINRGESVKALTKNIIPYPTLSDLNKQVVGEYYKPLLFSSKVKVLVKFLKLFW